MTEIELTVMTTTPGNPSADKQNAFAAGPRGSLRMVDHQRIYASH
jgi:catalase